MGRGSSEPQLPSSNTRPGTAAPRGSAASTAAGIRRRRASGSASGSGSGGGGLDVGRNMLRFYTDDAPGMKVSPTAVLVMSLFFIGCVTALHVFGKLYRKSSAYPGSGSD
ncbi:hypothetical protein RND81_09G068300 [Saponaria officinalis]|uniref:Protein transport protein Sec61 subunit beta n=1 Tax=Saponaria officinalis TaxID=3572 RepID=A0AAW1IHL9_SAPOF